MSKAQERMTLAAKILWRVLFWSGLFTMMTGTGVANSYVNNVFHGQVYLIGGFAFIVLGIALMVTASFVFQGRIRIQKRHAI